ncbi:MAG: sulfatase-like hydrolase/transferase, partial [Verrucomicrobiales bacterium]|nr:sulfatase-like hydrolase/transferase [Verrucomicrobiales bacterium]
GSVLADSPVSPGQSGFDQWLSGYNFYDNNPVLSREGKATELEGESSIIAADAAIDFIKQQTKQKEKKPFLAVVWFGSPHVPHRAAPEDLAHYQNQKDAHWLGEITGLDRAVGKLRNALRHQNIADDTLLWYTSDNGGLKTASSGGRGKKGSIYEGGLRVPAIIEWPAKITKPRITKTPANTADIYPTVLDLLNIKPAYQPALDGISLAPVIAGTSDTREKPMGFWAYPGGGIGTPSDKWMREELAAQKAGKPYHDASRLRLDAAGIKKNYPRDQHPGHTAWIDWPWKLHQINGKKNLQTFELYNLESDPMESKNLATTHPDRTKTMHAALSTWLTSVVDSLNGNDYQ